MNLEDLQSKTISSINREYSVEQRLKSGTFILSQYVSMITSFLYPPAAGMKAPLLQGPRLYAEILDDMKLVVMTVITLAEMMEVNAADAFRKLNLEVTPPSRELLCVKLNRYATHLFVEAHTNPEAITGGLLTHDLLQLLYFLNVTLTEMGTTLDALASTFEGEFHGQSSARS